jgi:hypothetical protein
VIAAGAVLVGLALGMGAWFGFATPLGAVVFAFDPTLLAMLQSGIQRNLSPALWNDVLQPVLVAPNGTLPGGLGVLLLLLALGRRRFRG